MPHGSWFEKLTTNGKEEPFVLSLSKDEGPS